MKTFLCAFVFILFLLPNAQAQKSFFGPELGVLVSRNSDFDFDFGLSRRYSYALGVNYTYQLNKHLYLNTGIQYLSQGYVGETCYIFPEGVSNKLIIKTDYLILPILVKYGFGKENRIKMALGMYGAYNILATQEHPVPIGGCLRFYPYDLRESVEDFYLGAIAELSYLILNKDLLNLELRLKHFNSITNVTFYDLSNSSYSLGLNFNFKI